MNQDIITREKVTELEIKLNKIWEEQGCLARIDALYDIQEKVVRHLQAHGINQIAVPVNRRSGLFEFIRCRDMSGVIDDGNQQSCTEGCQSYNTEPTSDEIFDEYLCDMDTIKTILLTMDQLTEHGIPTSEWHKAQDISVYCNLRDLVTREQIDRIEEGLIKAKNAHDMKEYFRLSTILQKGVVAILESNGINQIALKYDDGPEYEFIKGFSSYDIDDLGCCLQTMDSIEEPSCGDYIDCILDPETARSILDRIDRYKELGVPHSKWHKPLDLSKYTDKTTPTA